MKKVLHLLFLVMVASVSAEGKIYFITNPGTSTGTPGNGTGTVTMVDGAGPFLTGGPITGAGTLYINSSAFCLSNGTNCVGGNGTPGANGTGIQSTILLANGSLSITYTNGTTVYTNNVTGQPGAAGSNGAPGSPGSNGNNGTGILIAVLLSNGSLNITYTNGTQYISANITGQPGSTGPAGPAGNNGTNGLNGSGGSVQVCTTTGGGSGNGSTMAVLLPNTTIGLNSQTLERNLNDFLYRGVTLYNTTQLLTNGTYTLLWVPWYSSSTACGVGELKTYGSLTTATMNNNTMVTDEFSEVGVSLSMGNSTIEKYFDAWYNTYQVLPKNARGLLPWVFSRRYANFTDESGSTSSASDATQRIMLALYTASENPSFSTDNRTKYLSLAQNITILSLKYEVLNTCKTSATYGQICYFPFAGDVAQSSGIDRSDVDYYQGYIPDTLKSFLAAYAQTGNVTYLNAVNNITLAYLSGVQWKGTGVNMTAYQVTWNDSGSDIKFSNGGGGVNSYYWTPGNPQWDTADATRALKLCEIPRLYNITIGTLSGPMTNLTQYCTNWANAPANSRYIDNSTAQQYQFNGTGYATNDGYFYNAMRALSTGTTNQSWFKGQLEFVLGKYDGTNYIVWGTSCGNGLTYETSHTTQLLGIAIGKEFNTFNITGNTTTTTCTNVTPIYNNSDAILTTLNVTYLNVGTINISMGGDNATWNQALAATLFYPLASNPLGYLNTTNYYPLLTNPLGYYNSTTLTNLYPILTNPLGYYNSSTLPAYPTGDNQTWNQTKANTLYANRTETCWSNGTNCAATGGDNATWNQALASTLYYPLPTNPLNYYNSTTFTNYYPLATNPLNYYNSSTLTNLYPLLTNPLGYYNSTSPPPGGNSSWNETRGNAIYYPLITNPLGYYNISSGLLDNTTWNETKADADYYPRNTNPQGFYNSSTLPASGTAALHNVTFLEGFRSVLYAAGPAGISLSGMNATARCTSFVIDSGFKAYFDNVKVMVDNTNASIGMTIAIYNCTSSNTWDCSAGTLLYNFTKFSLGTSAMQGPTNTTGNWSLSAGDYVTCESTNASFAAPTAVVRGSTGSAGTGSTLRLTVKQGIFPDSASFTSTESYANPYVYLYRSTGAD